MDRAVQGLEALTRITVDSLNQAIKHCRDAVINARLNKKATTEQDDAAITVYPLRGPDLHNA